MTPSAIDSSIQVVADVFRSYRTELLGQFGQAHFVRKRNRTPVTEWDIKIEKSVRRAIHAHDPSVGFEGEETGRVGGRDRYWLVDPIDGTSSFIRGLDYTTNMAALVVNDEVVASVIYDFIRDHLFVAVKGRGATRDGDPITVNTERRRGNLVIYSFTRRKFPLIREALSEIGMRAILPMGAAGHMYCLLAQGKIDGIVALNTGLAAYDNAPGILLCEEAGAVMLQYDDKTGVDRHEFIIGSPYVINAIERSGLI